MTSSVNGLQSLIKHNRSPDVRGDEVSVRQLMNRSMQKAGFKSAEKKRINDGKLPSVHRNSNK
jgi:hypothetical protein